MAGELNSATGVPATADSLFQVGSITKIWTATMIMQLADEGQLSLDTTVAEVLPGARLGAGDVGGQVTVRHLHAHQRYRRRRLHRHRPGRRVRGALHRPAGRDPSVFSPARPIPMQQRFRGARPDHRGPRRPVLDESLRERLISPLALTRTVTLPEEAILHRAAVGHRRGGAPVGVWNLPRSVGPAALITAAAGDCSPSPGCTSTAVSRPTASGSSARRRWRRCRRRAPRFPSSPHPARPPGWAGAEPLGKPDDHRPRRTPSASPPTCGSTPRRGWPPAC